MIALIIAVLAGLIFCLASVLLRKEIFLSNESYTPVPISCFIGAILIGGTILVTGEVKQLAAVSWQSVAWLSAAGVIHFIGGRTFVYIGYRYIGVNRSNPITTSNVLVTVLGGAIFLGEPISAYLALAVVLIMAGILFISRTGGTEGGGRVLTRGALLKGVFFTLGGALCWGTSPIMVKLGMSDGISSLTATFISYAAASLAIGFSLVFRANRDKFRMLNRQALTLVIIASIALAVAHLLRYIALNTGSVSMVSPVFGSMSALFVFPMAYFISRKIEVFNPAVITGAVLITAGVLLIFLKL